MFTKYIALYFLAIVAFIVSCNKLPNLSITANKTEYVAGDTVKLKSTNNHGTNFVWAMPNGESINAKNAEYVIDPNTDFTDLTFSLRAKSKISCHHNTKNITVSVVPRSWFANSYQIYVPYLVTINSNTNIYCVYAKYQNHDQKYGSSYTAYGLNICFSAGNSPPAGTYTLQTSSTNLAPFTAFINKYGGAPDASVSTDYVVGHVQVEYTHNRLHVFFTDVWSGDGLYKLSGSIYKPL